MNEMTPADVAAVTRNNCDNGGWGDFGGGAWWLVLLFLLGGFGYGGYGGYGGGGGGNGLSRQLDMSTLITKLDGQTYGLADSTFALNNAITGGFSNAELSRCNMQSALTQQIYGVQSAVKDCCCETQRSLADINYNIANQACETRHAICDTTRDIIENANANSRAILDALTADRLAAKDAKIAEQTQQIFGLQLAASQAAQNNYLINQLKQPCPIPAYQVPNPYAYQGNCNPCGCC